MKKHPEPAMPAASPGSPFTAGRITHTMHTTMKNRQRTKAVERQYIDWLVETRGWDRADAKTYALSMGRPEPDLSPLDDDLAANTAVAA
jgi:hypothetical protein